MSMPPLPPALEDEHDADLPPGFPSNSERNWAVFCHLVGFALLAGLAVFHFVLMVIASVRASEGRPYRYPLTIRLI